MAIIMSSSERTRRATIRSPFLLFEIQMLVPKTIHHNSLCSNYVDFLCRTHTPGAALDIFEEI
jgi:hypothetical protein